MLDSQQPLHNYLALGRFQAVKMHLQPQLEVVVVHNLFKQLEPEMKLKHQWRKLGYWVYINRRYWQNSSSQSLEIVFVCLAQRLILLLLILVWCWACNIISVSWSWQKDFVHYKTILLLMFTNNMTIVQSWCSSFLLYWRCCSEKRLWLYKQK